MTPEPAEYRPWHLPGCPARSVSVADEDACTVCTCPPGRFLPDPDPVTLAWRTGRHVGRTVYAMEGPEPSDDDVLIGVMDTPELAAEAVAGHNALLEARLA